MRASRYNGTAEDRYTTAAAAASSAGGSAGGWRNSTAAATSEVVSWWLRRMANSSVTRCTYLLAYSAGGDLVVSEGDGQRRLLHLSARASK